MYKICKYYEKLIDVLSSNVSLFKLREDRNCQDGLDHLTIYRSCCQGLKKCDFEINAALKQTPHRKRLKFDKRCGFKSNKCE